MQYVFLIASSSRSLCHNKHMVKKQRRTEPLLKKINYGLILIALGLGLYILLSPLIPQLGWWVEHRGKVDAPSVSTAPQVEPANIPKENLLVIPRLNMRETVHSGQSATELNKGPWLIPATSTPDQASNTVIAGHRFTYSGPAVFYFLDKVQVNDFITLYWNQQTYNYKVSSIRVVPPTDTSVQAPTTTPQITLYTCTPLWTAKKRLVVTGLLEGEHP